MGTQRSLTYPSRQGPLQYIEPNEGKNAMKSPEHFPNAPMWSHTEKRPTFEKVTRLTVVGPEGRVIELWDINSVTALLQDEGRTLKIFFDKERGRE